MYDRRVVRGNTFAALIIPVSKYNCEITGFRYAGWSSINRKTKARLDHLRIEKRADESKIIVKYGFRKEEKMIGESNR